MTHTGSKDDRVLYVLSRVSHCLGRVLTSYYNIRRRCFSIVQGFHLDKPGARWIINWYAHLFTISEYLFKMVSFFDIISIMLQYNMLHSDMKALLILKVRDLSVEESCSLPTPLAELPPFSHSVGSFSLSSPDILSRRLPPVILTFQRVCGRAWPFLLPRKGRLLGRKGSSLPAHQGCQAPNLSVWNTWEAGEQHSFYWAGAETNDSLQMAGTCLGTCREAHINQTSLTLQEVFPRSAYIVEYSETMEDKSENA